MRETIAILLDLTKVRIAVMATASALLGWVLAAQSIGMEALATMAGVYLLASAAGALNQVQEHELDARMPRTKGRPIPTGRLSVVQGTTISVVLLAAGLFCLSGNATGLALGVLTVVWYNAVYTPLKRVSPLAAIPGGVVGSLPPVIGWVAAGGDLYDPRIVAVATFFFVWQVPHFWLLLMRIGHEYERAGMPTLTAILSRKQLTRVTYVWMLATGVSCMVIPVLMAPALWIWIGLAVSSVWLVYHATRMLRSGGAVIAFHQINVYALLVMMLLSAGSLVG